MDQERFFNIVNSLLIVDADGRYQVKVTKEPFLYNPEDYGDEGNPRYIVATNAITHEGSAKLKKFINEIDENTAEEEYQTILNEVVLTHSSWIGPNGEAPDFLPAKGEQVNITCAMVPTREGGESLRINSLTQLHKGAVKKFSFKKVEEQAEVPNVK